jgi:hypothetical protein
MKGKPMALMNINLSSNVRMDRKLKLAMLAVCYDMTSSQVLDMLLEQAVEPDRYQEFQAELTTLAEHEAEVTKDYHQRKLAVHARMHKLIERYRELKHGKERAQA